MTDRPRPCAGRGLRRPRRRPPRRQVGCCAAIFSRLYGGCMAVLSMIATIAPAAPPVRRRARETRRRAGAAACRPRSPRSSRRRCRPGSVALFLCTTAHPLHTRSTEIFGPSASGATAGPDPRWRRCARRGAHRRPSPRRWPQGSVALPLCTTAHPLYTSFTNIFGASVSESTMRPHPRWPC
jgi:hypothetical protein